MYYVYVILGQNNKIYVGYTSDLRERMRSHNAVENEYTKKFRPWGLVYYEAYFSLQDAKNRESKLKYRGRAKTLLKQRLFHSLQEIRNSKGAR